MKHLKLFENFNNGRNLSIFLEELKRYNLKRGDYAIFGSAPLVAKGIIDDVNDLDVIIKPSKWTFNEAGEYRTKNIEFFDNWYGFDIEDLIDNHTFEHDGFDYVDLEWVMKYKRMLSRSKDKDLI